MATGDLFRVDADGDFWWVDTMAALVHTARGAVGTVPIERVLGAVPGVDLAAVYGVRPDAETDEVVLAAVTERDGHEITPASLTAAVMALPAHHRPAVVHVIEQMPRTTWFRPRKVPLRDAGLPGPDARGWAWDDEAHGYLPLDADRLAALAG